MANVRRVFSHAAIKIADGTGRFSGIKIHLITILSSCPRNRESDLSVENHRSIITSLLVLPPIETKYVPEARFKFKLSSIPPYKKVSFL